MHRKRLCCGLSETARHAFVECRCSRHMPGLTLGSDIQGKLRGQGSGRRGRSEPPPYSGLCAFSDPAFLHVIEGSHEDFLADDYDWADAREVIIPPGYGILFHRCLVHAGGSYERVNGRLHLYFKCATGAQTADGTFKQVKQRGLPPP
ncbi:unnamed protein product, partial [Ectocarpus sp. 4 AP-2014]